MEAARKASAANGLGWKEFVFKILVAQFVLHLALYVVVRLAADRWVLEEANMPLRPHCTLLRYSRSAPGLVANSAISCPLKTCCSRPCTGETQEGSRMKVVTLGTFVWIAGETSMPDELEVISVAVMRIFRARTYPFPTKPMCFPSRSIWSSQMAVCSSVPLYLLGPRITGHLQLFTMPLALMRISQESHSLVSSLKF